MNELAQLYKYDMYTSDDDNENLELVYHRETKGICRLIVEYTSGSTERFTVSPEEWKRIKKEWELELDEDDESVWMLDTES